MVGVTLTANNPISYSGNPKFKSRPDARKDPHMRNKRTPDAKNELQM
jgi:hypothetical protein